MTKTTKTNTKAKAKANTKSKAKEPDLEVEIAGDIWLSIYNRSGKNDSCKITLKNAFVIFGKIIQSDNGPFISYPNWKDKNGEYHNQAYCFDKEINETIKETLDEYYEYE